MRILTVGSLYPPQHLGGYELVWQAAVRALRDAGHDVRVLATSTRFPGVHAAEEEEDVHRDLRWYWSDHVFPRLSPHERLRLERHNHAVLGRHLADLRPHLVSWWHMGGMSLSLLERVRRQGLPALGWVNDDWLLYGPLVDQWTSALARRRALRLPAERLTGIPAAPDLDRAARWIFCSDATRRSAAAVLSRPQKTAVLHQGVAPEFRPAPDAGSWQGRLLYVGRIDPRKGLATLLEALDILPGHRLRVVGGGDPEEEARLRELADPARVTFEGRVTRSELPTVYASADAVVFPVEWDEPYGLVPLEAMAVGRPVVATGKGGSAEYLEAGANALLFDAGNAASLAQAVSRLASDPDLRARLRAGGLRTAERLTEAAWTAAVVAEHEAAVGRRPLSPAAR